MCILAEIYGGTMKFNYILEVEVIISSCLCGIGVGSKRGN
uniref:Transcription factor UNE10 n=1 Tax=Rhizophora mucronata TaxID=61149 RepID=A0A2P2JBU7_RHIMU